jgi:hypothetical protein
MKIIDKKGKLFGLINVIDLFVLLAVVGAVAFFGMRTIPTIIEIGGGGGDMYIVQYYAEDMPSFVGNFIKIDDRVQDESKFVDLGRVTGFELSNGWAYGFDDGGRSVRSPREGHSTLLLTTEVRAVQGDYGIVVGGNIYGVGHSFTIRVGDAKIFLRVFSIERAN